MRHSVNVHVMFYINFPVTRAHVNPFALVGAPMPTA